MLVLQRWVLDFDRLDSYYSEEYIRNIDYDEYQSSTEMPPEDFPIYRDFGLDWRDYDDLLDFRYNYAEDTIIEIIESRHYDQLFEVAAEVPFIEPQAGKQYKGISGIMTIYNFDPIDALDALIDDCGICENRGEGADDSFVVLYDTDADDILAVRSIINMSCLGLTNSNWIAEYGLISKHNEQFDVWGVKQHCPWHAHYNGRD